MKNNQLLKEEIQEHRPVTECCRVTALKVAFRLYGTLRITSQGPSLEFKKEDKSLLRRTIGIFKEAFPGKYDFEIMYDEKKFWVNIHVSPHVLSKLGLMSESGFLPDVKYTGECCAARILMEVMLYKGYLFSFEDSYQLEIRKPDPFTAVIKKVFENNGVKYYEYDQRIIVKGITNLMRLFEYMGLDNTVSALSDFRNFRENKNRTVRLVNYNMANLDRQVRGYEKDKTMLHDFSEQFGFDILGDELREVATIRLNSPGLSLSEIGALLKPPVTKGGVSSRIKKIYALYSLLKGSER